MTQNTQTPDLVTLLTGRILLDARRAGLQLRQPTMPSRLRAANFSGLDLATAPTTPITEEQFRALLLQLLPDILATGRQIDAALADRRLSWTEAAALGTTLLGVVSKAVHEGAPYIQDHNAEDLVLLIYGVIFEQFVPPRLPLWLRPAAPFIKAGVVKGLEALYRAVIKRPRTALS